jgi:hypothetical protein
MSHGAGGQENFNRNKVLGMAGLGGDFVDGTASSGAVTVTGKVGKITSESLTTAKDAVYTLTMTNTEIAAGDIVLASVALGTATTGVPVLGTVKPAAGSCVFLVHNKDTGSAAFNGTIVVSYLVVKAFAADS